MRLSVLDYQLRPNSRGKFGAIPTQNNDCFSALIGGISTLLPTGPTIVRNGHLCRFGTPKGLKTYWSALRASNQVKWTVRPRYCACQVTNATSCILHLAEGTR